MIVPDATRPFVPLGSIGMAADNNGRVISVDDGGPAARQHVVPATLDRPGDTIDLHATGRAALLDVFGGLGGMQYLPVGRTVTLRLIAANGRRHDATMTARAVPLTTGASIVLECDQVLGVGFVVLGAFLFWVYPKRSTLGFFLFAIWFNPGQYFTYYAYLPRGLIVPQEVLQAVFEAAGIAGFLAFALRFPNDRVEGWRAGVERALPALFVVLTALGLASFGTELGRPSELISRIAYASAYAVYPLVVVAFVTKLRVLSAADALRLRWVIAGCIPGLLFFIVADSIESTSMWQRLWDTLNWQPPESWLNLAYMVNALVAVSVGYAVIRQRVLPIAFLVNRGLVLGIVWATVTMGVEAVLVVTHTLLEDYHVVSSILTALLVVASAPLLERFQERLNHAVDQLFFRRFHEAETQLAHVAATLSGASSLDGVERQLLDAPCEAFGIASAALFSARDDGGFALAPSSRGWPPEAATAFDANDPLVLHVREFPGPLRLHDVLRSTADLPTGPAFPAIVVPLRLDRTVDAFVMYGGHRSGTDLSPDEIAALVRLAEAAAAAREHVRSVALCVQLDGLRSRLAGLSPAAG
jgi:hypothetical protein